MTGEATAEICIEAALAVLADGTIGVEGLVELGLATGVDLYGLLDLQVGVKGEAYIELAAMLEAGIAVTANICLNAGIANTTELTIEATELELPEGMEDLVAQVNGVMVEVYSEIPAIVANLPIGPEHISSGVNALAMAVNNGADMAAETLLDPSAWGDLVAGLPGADALTDRFDAVAESFNTLRDGDVCGFFGGLGGTISGDVGGFVTTVCNAVPAGVGTSLAFAENAANTVWGALQSIERIRFLVDDVIEGAVGAIQSGVNGIRNVVDDIKGLANDILDFVDIL